MAFCDVCTAIQFHNILKAEGQPHHKSIRDLSVSANACGLCALLFSICQSTSLGDDIPIFLHGNRYVEGPKAIGDGIDRAGLLSVELCSRTQKSLEQDLGVKKFLDEEEVMGGQNRFGCHIGGVTLYAEKSIDTPAAISGDILGRPVGAADDVRQVQEWLERCRSNHPYCSRAGAAKIPTLPTRVIDVSGFNESGEPMLVEAQGLSSEYVALSHRWGGAHIARTTQSNLCTHKKQIPFSQLCATFRDAITATKNLGYRYLWIDSLCIIQDSAEDWEVESSRMADIYRDAILTLSAACATSGDTGLFLGRETAAAVEMPYNSTRCVSGGCYYISNRKVMSFGQEVVDGPLNTRGWTLQERHLSRRILHFGRTQLFWECQTAIWEESSAREHSAFDRFGGHLIDGFLANLSSYRWGASSPQVERLEVAGNEYSAWYWIISHYTRRAMTKGDDKLPAISGLARMFATYRKDNYLAGLWETDFPLGLLWCNDMGRSLCRPAHPRAPSWSWAAWDGRIAFETDWDGRVEVEDIVVTVELAGSDAYGKVKSGTARLTGFLASIQTAPEWELASEFGWSRANARLIDRGGNLVGAGCCDEGRPARTSLVHCLMIFQVFIGFRPLSPKILNRRGQWCWCLLLNEVGNGTFKRAGLGQVDQGVFKQRGKETLILT